MDRPVVAAGLAELAGAVERVDDPHAVGREATGVLETFLRQHGVIGAVHTELLSEELLGQRVAGVLDVPRRRARSEHLRPQFEEHVPRLRREPRREFGVGLGVTRHRVSLPAASRIGETT